MRPWGADIAKLRTLIDGLETYVKKNPPKSGNLYKFIAGEILGGQRLVMLVNGKAVYYDPTDENNVGKLLGMTNHAATTGFLVDVVEYGVITSGGWGLIPNTIYYPAPNGMITITPPSPPFIWQRVGIAINTESMDLEFSEPLIII